MVVLNHEVYGVMDRLETQEDIRDVLTRVVRIESAIAKIQLQTAESQSQLLTAVQDKTAASQCKLMETVLTKTAESQSQLLTAVQNQTAASQSQLVAELRNVFNSMFEQSQVSMVTLVKVLIAESQSKSSSPELGPIKICSFPDCSTLSPKDLSATLALRHMELCPFCSGQDTDRYLHIVQHMTLFQQYPRVTDVDTCCWCNVTWEAKVTPDSRSRHRKICHQTTLRQLQNPSESVAVTQRLIRIWTNTVPASPSGLKRPRKEKEAVPPFSPPTNAYNDTFIPWTFCNNAEGAEQHIDFSLMSPSSDSDNDGLEACDMDGCLATCET